MRGEHRPRTIDVGGVPPAPDPIQLRSERVRAILGVEVAPERQAEILRALDFEVADAPDGLLVGVPAVRRNDVTREIDLIEEVARIDGVERLPVTLPARRGAAGRLSHAQHVRRGAEDLLGGRGLSEIVGWSFADPGLLDRLRLPADARAAPRGAGSRTRSRRTSRSCARRWSARCWTPPATTPTATVPTSPCSSRAASTGRARTAPAPTNTTRSGCC